MSSEDEKLEIKASFDFSDTALLNVLLDTCVPSFTGDDPYEHNITEEKHFNFERSFEDDEHSPGADLLVIKFSSKPLGFQAVPNEKGFGFIVSEVTSQFCIEEGLQVGDVLIELSGSQSAETLTALEFTPHHQILKHILDCTFPLKLVFEKYQNYFPEPFFDKEPKFLKNPFVGFWKPGKHRLGKVEITENHLLWPQRFGEGVKIPLKIQYGRLYVEADGIMHIGLLSKNCIKWKNKGVWVRVDASGKRKNPFSRKYNKRNRHSWGKMPAKEQFVGTWFYGFDKFFRVELRPVKPLFDTEEYLQQEAEKYYENCLKNETEESKEEEPSISYTDVSNSDKQLMLENYKLMKCFSGDDFENLPQCGPKDMLWYIEDNEEYGHIEVPLATTNKISGYIHDGDDIYIVLKKSGMRIHYYFRPHGKPYWDRSKIVQGVVKDEPLPPTNKELAQNWTIPPNWSDKCVASMITFLGIFYDFSAAFISLVDVTTDALVTREFYKEEKFLFFYLSLCIMLIAHLSFSFIFIGLYCNHTWTDKHRIMLWFAMVPFSQAVPLFIWLHSFEFEWFMRMLEWCSFHTEQPGSHNIREDDDVLMVWIKKKFSSHGGFIAEACIEAFPQSILQMISIVVYHEHTTLNLISVIISMTAVASKSVMLSYNIDRRVFLFNFACFVGDIFNVFATIAWVFHHDEKGVFLKSAFSWIWVYKICGLAFMIIILGILHFRRFMFEVHSNCCHPWDRTCEGIFYFLRGCCKNLTCRDGNRICEGQDGCWINLEKTRAHIDCNCYCNCGFRLHQTPCCKYRSVNMCNSDGDYLLLFLEYVLLWPVAAIMFVIMGSGLYIFSILASEIFKLGFFPLMIFGAGQKHRSAAPFYRYLFSFLQTSRDDEDCKLRLALTNQYLLKKHFEEVPTDVLESTDAVIARRKYEYFCNRDPTNISYSAMYGFDPTDEKITLSECLHLCCVTGVKKNFCNWLRCRCFDTAEECYLLTVFGPYDVLTALFTIFFPIVGMIITPYNKWTLLQTTLTIIYLVSFLTVICLSIYVFKFFRLTNSIFAPIEPTVKKPATVDATIAFWKDFIASEMRNKMVKDFFLDVAPIILDYTGKHRVHSTSWVPPLNWKALSHVEGTYLDAMYYAPQNVSSHENDVQLMISSNESVELTTSPIEITKSTINSPTPSIELLNTTPFVPNSPQNLSDNVENINVTNEQFNNLDDLKTPVKPTVITIKSQEDQRKDKKIEYFEESKSSTSRKKIGLAMEDELEDELDSLEEFSQSLAIEDIYMERYRRNRRKEKPYRVTKDFTVLEREYGSGYITPPLDDFEYNLNDELNLDLNYDFPEELAPELHESSAQTYSSTSPHRPCFDCIRPTPLDVPEAKIETSRPTEPSLTFDSTDFALEYLPVSKNFCDSNSRMTQKKNHGIPTLLKNFLL